MKPRIGLYIALVGFVIAGACFSILGLIAVFEERLPPTDVHNPTAFWGIILLDLGLVLGFIVMVVGLTIAGVVALAKQSGKPS